jgi:hypothetical protein
VGLGGVLLPSASDCLLSASFRTQYATNRGYAWAEGRKVQKGASFCSRHTVFVWLV